MGEGGVGVGRRKGEKDKKARKGKEKYGNEGNKVRRRRFIGKRAMKAMKVRLST